MGIINGTTNYILSKMEDENASFEACYAMRRQKGLPRRTRKNDVEGFDAMYKLSILSSMAFHARVPIEYIYREGIAKVTQQDIQFGKELGVYRQASRNRQEGRHERLRRGFILR